MKIISNYPNFKNKGGAQDITIQLAKKLNGNIPIVLTDTPMDKIHPDYKKENIHFEKFSIYSIFKYNAPDTVFLSHHRSQTSRLMFLNYTCGSQYFHKLKTTHLVTGKNRSHLQWRETKSH